MRTSVFPGVLACFDSGLYDIADWRKLARNISSSKGSKEVLESLGRISDPLAS